MLDSTGTPVKHTLTGGAPLVLYPEANQVMTLNSSYLTDPCVTEMDFGFDNYVVPDEITSYAC
jgi:hypothetical protein